MALFNWSNEYSVNIKEIDEQHKVLISLINELHDKMKVGKAKEVLGDILDKLIDYTVYHFKHEENLFASNGYPDSNIHKTVHVGLVQQVKEIKKNFEGGKVVLSMEVMNFLKGWLGNHILGTDKKYSSYLNSKGVS
jgi:hemerythrin